MFDFHRFDIFFSRRTGIQNEFMYATPKLFLFIVIERASALIRKMTKENKTAILISFVNIEMLWIKFTREKKNAHTSMTILCAELEQKNSIYDMIEMT